MTVPVRDQGPSGPGDGPPHSGDIYRTIFEHIPLGCAHCQVVCQGEETADWIFLATNRAFESATGLTQVAGRKVSDAIPGFLQTSPGLLATMGRVAGSGAPEAFETFVAALGRWFAMQVFSPALGQFVATFENITARRQGEDPGSGQVCPERRPAVPQAAPVPNKVLLVDDDEDVRFLMARMLRRGGVPQVETASGGEEAMDCLAQGTIPDVIILDQNMPGMTGVQALGRIRRLHPDIPVLFSSGQPDLPEKGCLDQAKVAVIGKPFTLAELQAKISQFDRLSDSR